MNNYEKIKSMSIAKMTNFLKKVTETSSGCDGCPARIFCSEKYELGKECKDMIRGWLESEVAK